MSYETDWIKVGVAGKTVDGRDIEEQWLLDAARLYSLQEYQAQVWAWSHYSKYETYGVVTAVKTARDSHKRLALYVKLKPEPYLIELNRRGQLKYTSMELRLNYKGDGLAYLTGLLFTNNPASTGLEQINLSTEKSDPDINLSTPESFNDSLDDPAGSIMPAWFKPFAKLFSAGDPPDDPIEDTVFMTPEQFEKYEALQQRQIELQEQNLAATQALEAKLGNFSDRPAASGEAEDKVEENPPAEDPPAEPAALPTEAQFQSMIDKAVSKFMAEPDGDATDVPRQTGAAEDLPQYDY